MRQDYWEEKPYMGSIQIDHSREIIIKPGIGGEILNWLIDHQGFPIEDLEAKLMKKYFQQNI